jgi:FHA domain/Zinc-ribbon containing domain
MNQWRSGEVTGGGSFHCAACQYSVSLNAIDAMPLCPRCYGTRFVRSSLFEDARTVPMEMTAPPDLRGRGWIEDVRRDLDTPGQYLTYKSAIGECVAFRLRRGWTRVGRSSAAQIRFDDPTVSRRHALIVRQPDGLRILDDRSINGVFVNGERVEWSVLADGDEIVVGRHHLHFVDVGVGRGPRADFRAPSAAA